MAMAMGRGGDDEDEDEERMREEQEERREKNRIWRENRERERRRMRGEVSEDEDEEEEDWKSVSSHISQVQSFLTCSSCERRLTGRIWQCSLGHPVCKNCVDEIWLKDDYNSSQDGSGSVSSMDGRSSVSDDSIKGLIEQPIKSG